MKTVFFTLILLFTININAQKVKLKDDKLLIDNTEVLSYKKGASIREIYFYPLNSNDELIYIKFDDNGTFEYDGDNFVRLYFAKNKVKIESKSLRFGWKGVDTIKKLVFEGVLSLDGSINEDKLKIFTEKFNDVIQK